MIKADVIVVGGGAIGTSAAYYVSQTGAQVILIDRQDIASGTSSRCDGNIVVHDMLPHQIPFARKAQDIFPGLADEIGYDINWKRRGSVLLIDTELEYDVAVKHTSEMVAIGQPYRIMDRKEVHDEEPRLGPKVVGGMEVACDGSLNPMYLAFGFMEAARRNGASFVGNTEVTGILKNDDGSVAGVKTDGGEFHAPAIIDAAGAWANKISAMVGIHIPMEPRRGDIIVAERTGGIAKRKMSEFAYITTKLQLKDYKRPISDEMAENGICFVFEPCEIGNFLIGSSRWFNGFDVRSSPKHIKLMAQRAMDFFPCIQEARAIRTYAGLRPYSEDHTPIVCETAVPGFYLATGHEGSGILYSPITGLLLSQLITKDPNPIIDPSLWDMKRFINKEAH
jgi:sarcosine oxidase subunit beta